MTSVGTRLRDVRERIAVAAAAAERSAEKILLVAVSKTKPPEAIREAYEAGQRDFGENYVQELARKAEALADLADLRWHLVGHLQRNKARAAAPLVSVVHTVDSPTLARELGKRAAGSPVAESRRFPLAGGPEPRLLALAEVNVGGEAQKNGCSPAELAGVLAAIEAEAALRLAGLMTVPPHTEDPAGARPFFDALVALRDAHGGAARLPELSMGMTHDLEHAVAAGATIVRVGTAVFGERA